MGILDQVLGGLMGGAGGGSPMQGVLANLLGGNQGAAQGQGQTGQSQPGQSQPGQTGMQGMGGGIGNLISMFASAGLGGIAQSWVGHGANQPVSPQQLQSVFGQDRVQNMASQAGMAPNDFLSQLSQHLPAAVDGMTPNGKLPDEGSVSV